MARIAVTGATGFVGSHVVDALLDRGHDVVAVVRSPHKGAHLAQRGVDLRKADLTDPDALTAGFAGTDAVFSVAALSIRGKAPYRAFWQANVAGTEHVLQAARDAGVRRIVHISTVGVYRTRLNTTMTEATPLLQTREDSGWARWITNWDYALTKAIGEARAWTLADRWDLQLTTLRPGPVWGPRDHKLTTSYRQWMARPLAPMPTLRLPHVHARDVADAMCGALANSDSIGQAYNTTGPSLSPYRILSTWKRLAGRGPAILPIPVPVHVDFDDARAARDLGFQARNLEAALASILADESTR